MRHLSFCLGDGVPRSWAIKVWHKVNVDVNKSLWILPLHASIGKGEAVVKTYMNPPKHKRLRSLIYGRSAIEAKGFRIFNNKKVSTVPFLFYAQERHFGIVKKELVATIRVVASNIEEAYLKNPDPDLLRAAAYKMALIHKAGLAHGDPRLNNFLATLPCPLVFDLPGWARFNTHTQIKDLIRFFTSIIIVSKNNKILPALIDRYETIGLTIPIPVEKLIQMAEHSAKKKQKSSVNFI